MQMYFTNALPVTILFDWWVASTPATYAASLFVVAGMGFLRRSLVWLQAWVAAAAAGGAGTGRVRSRTPPPVVGDCCSGEGPLLTAKQPDDDEMDDEPAGRRAPAHRPLLLLLDPVLFAASLALSYVNMLVTMTYNPGLLVAVVVGETVGVLLLKS